MPDRSAPIGLELTADAVFASDEGGRLVAWNAAAERLLGHPCNAVLGKNCYDVIRGADAFGNPYCEPNCGVRRLLQRGHPVHSFELEVKNASGESIRTEVSLIIVCNADPSRFTIFHLLKDAKDAGHAPWLPQSDPPDPRRAEAADTASGPSGDEGATPVAEDSRLTPREVEILRLLAGAQGVAEISQRLCISSNTVRTHIQRILGKLGAHTQLEAVCAARRRRLL